MRAVYIVAVAALGAWAELSCCEAADGARFLTKEELLRHKPFEGEYAKLWSKEFNDEIDARIEKFRKQDYVMRGFRSGETVEVEQVTSEFQVGCNMFNFGQLGKSEWDAQYRATWEKGGLFNAATVPFYWAIDRLVNHEWKTKTRVVADRDGMVRFRGFKGEYRVRRARP